MAMAMAMSITATTPAPERPDFLPLSHQRQLLLKAAGAFVFILLAAAVLTIRGGAMLTQAGYGTLATRLPDTDGAVAKARLLTSGTDDPESLAMASRQIRRRPASGTSLVWMSNRAANEGDDARAAAIAEAAGPLGWRDSQVQRLMYNRAFEAGNYAAALPHADALLRQGFAERELFDHFNSELINPPFAAALGALLAQRPDWSARYLTDAAEKAAPGSVAALLIDALRQGDPEPAQTGSVTRVLIGREAWTDAARILRAARHDPIPGWIDETSGARSDDWQFPQGLTVDAGADGKPLLRPTGSPTMDAASAIIALTPGAYTLVAGKAAELRALGWSWNINCLGAATRIERGAGDSFRIPSSCPLQRLSLRPRDREAQPLALPAVMRSDTNRTQD